MNRLLFGVIPIYGLLIAAAIGIGALLCGREEKRLGLPQDTTVDFALWVVPAAIIGARLYYVAFRWALYAPDPVRILKIWEGGLAIYGGVIGGAIAAFVFARVRRPSITVRPRPYQHRYNKNRLPGVLSFFRMPHSRIKPARSQQDS